MHWHYAIPMILKKKQRRIILKQEDNRFVSCRMSTGLRIKWYVSVGQCTRPFCTAEKFDPAVYDYDRY